MQIACPACAATYQVPEAMIGDGRQMRCVRCGENWFASPLQAGPAETPPPATLAVTQSPPTAKPPEWVEAPHTTATPEPATVLARPSPTLLLPLAWVVSAVVWLGGVYALWAMREPLSELWPPIARLYALFGLV